jgi:hypothetical protein
MLPLTLFTSTQFTAVTAVTFVIYGALGGALFLLPIQLQQVCGYTALEAGISLLPITAIMLTLSARSGALAARIGPRLQMSVGPVLVGIGLALLHRIDTGGNYLTEVLPAVTVLALGLATTVAPLTSTALSAVAAEHAGVASAVNNDVARAAALITVAVLPAAAGITGTAYLHAAQFSAGFHTVALIAGALCILGGALAAVTIRSPRHPQPAPIRSHCALDAPPHTPPSTDQADQATQADRCEPDVVLALRAGLIWRARSAPSAHTDPDRARNAPRPAARFPRMRTRQPPGVSRVRCGST